MGEGINELFRKIGKMHDEKSNMKIKGNVSPETLGLRDSVSLDIHMKKNVFNPTAADQEIPRAFLPYIPLIHLDAATLRD